MTVVFTLLNGKLRFEIRANDHLPPHIHVVYGNQEKSMVVNLETLKVLKIYKFRSNEVILVLKKIEDNQNYLMEVWNDYQNN